MLKNETAYYLTLTDKERLEFLARLSFHLSEIARGSYPEAGHHEASSLKKLKAYNEMIHVVSKQCLAETRGETSGYPHDIFLHVLLEEAKHGECEGGLSWAVAKCLMVGERR